ncbi:dUTP metabolic process [Pristimantis euphronides]
MILHLQEGRYAFGVSRTQIQARPVLVGKVKMPPVHIPPAAKMVAMKQYRIPGGHKEITETIRELVEVGVMRPTTTAWNNPVWPVKKSDGSWRMTVDYRELNKQTPPLTAAVPDTITIVEAIQSHPGTWYAVIDLANAFFTIPIEEKAQDQFAFTWLGRQYTFTRLPQGWLHSPTICHRVVAEHLDGFALPAGMQFSHYIDDIMIQGDGKERVQEQLTLLIAHMKGKGWEINENKVQGPSEVVKFLGIQWNKGHREILPKGRQKVINFPIPKTKQETQSYIGLFGFWRQHIPHLGQLLAPLYKVTQNKYEFQWGEAEQLAFEAAKEAIQQAVDLWPMQEGGVELHVTVRHLYANWSLWQKQGGKRVPLGFWN